MKPLSWIRPIGYAATLLAMSQSSAIAQFLPAHPGRATNTSQNYMLGGQRSDLDFELNGLKFLTTPCDSSSASDKEILTGCEFDIELQWKTAGGYYQSDIASEIDGPDSLVILYKDLVHWHLQSVTRKGSSVLAGANPEAEEASGGIRITPPTTFDSGDYYPSASGREPLIYKFRFAYTPQPVECDVVPIRVRGTYTHTYDGTFEWSVDNAVSIGVSFPWGISLGATVRFTNNHAWSKELFDPNGTDHWGMFVPPETWAQQPCCPQNYVAPVRTDPNPPGGSPRCPGGDQGCFAPGHSFYFDASFLDSDDGLMSTELHAHSPDGLGLGLSSIEFSTPQKAMVGDVMLVTIPEDYGYGQVLIGATAFDARGGASHSTFIVHLHQNPVEPEVSHFVSLDTGSRTLVATGFTPGTALTFYTYTPSTIGDLDFDLDVDQDDRQRFMTTDWAKTDDLDDLHADLDLDGDVDSADYAILIANMGSDESGSQVVMPCEGIVLDVPNFTPYSAVVGEDGRAEVTLDHLSPQVQRLVYGAFSTGDCLASSPTVLLQR